MNKYQLKANPKHKTADLYIYGDIGEDFFGDQSLDAKTVVSEMNGLNASQINVRINSFGGSAADALAIFNGLRRHSATINSFIDGIAYSAGSLIAMAGDTIEMAENATMMIHGPLAVVAGNSTELRESADVLDKMAEGVISSYVRGNKVDESKVKQWLTDGADHYFSAKEAVEEGLVDSVGHAVEIAASFKPFQMPAAAGVSLEAKPMSGNDTTQTAGGDDGDRIDEYLGQHKAAKMKGQSAGAKAEHQRIRGIQQLFASFCKDPQDDASILMDSCIDDQNCGVDRAQSLLLKMLANDTDIPLTQTSQDMQLRPKRVEQIQHVAEYSDKFVDGVTKALLVKHNVERDREKCKEQRGSEFLSYSLTDICKESLRLSGKQTGGSKEDIIRRAVLAGPGQGSDHFPAILENIANKSVMDGFSEAEETWSQWTMSGTLNDYRSASRVNKSLFDKLDKMHENQEFEHGRFADVKQSITGFLHGKEFSLTLQAIVNDDLGMLSDDARAWGEAASVTIGDSAFTVLTASGSGGFGQTMDEDSQILFHADHSNYIASGSGAAPSKATIGAGRTAMMTQSDPNSRTVANMPRYLIHGTTLTLNLFELLNSQFYSSSTAAVQGERNAVASLGLTGVEEYRLDDTSVSPAATAWIMAAARRTVEVSFVGGQSTPRVDRMQVSNIPGVSWQISIPFGVAALDYRTLYFNFGA